MDNLEERVRERAYKLWLEEGCPEGRALEHWAKARELVTIEDNIDLRLKPLPLGLGEAKPKHQVIVGTARRTYSAQFRRPGGV